MPMVECNRNCTISDSGQDGSGNSMNTTAKAFTQFTPSPKTGQPINVSQEYVEECLEWYEVMDSTLMKRLLVDGGGEVIVLLIKPLLGGGASTFQKGLYTSLTRKVSRESFSRSWNPGLNPRSNE